MSHTASGKHMTGNDKLMLPAAISIDRLEGKLFDDQGVSVSIARLDKIHAEVSGNKIFKLHYFAEDCLHSSHNTLLSFGGAYSNHLAATAFFCREGGLKCIGVVRGEEHEALSHTLLRCKELGMQLHFLSREIYREKEDAAFITELHDRFGEFTLVPEGGYSAEGAKGAALINNFLEKENATHICTAAGTAVTAAGLLLSKQGGQKVIAVPVLKNMADLPGRIMHLTGEEILPVVFDEYHFGGYAKYTSELIGFMNDFYTAHGIPLDFVYTAKMMYGVTDKIKKGYFEKGSRIVCLHTGGLQGNESIAAFLQFL